MQVAKLLVAIVILAGPGMSARAAELVPKAMTGIWVEPNATDCQTAERIFLIGASAVLIFEQGSAEERVRYHEDDRRSRQCCTEAPQENRRKKQLDLHDRASGKEYVGI